MPRRRSGALVPLERDVLQAGIAAGERGERFHGFALAVALREAHGGGLVAHGTLYKALGRLRDAGLLDAVWEDPAVAEQEGRPRRKLYAVTPAGAAALRSAERDDRIVAAIPGWSTS